LLCLHYHLHSFPTRRSSDLEPTTLVSVDVLSTGTTDGDLTIGLYDVSTSTYIASHLEPITAGQYHTIPLNFDVPAAGTYRLVRQDRKSTRLNSSHVKISYAV